MDPNNIIQDTEFTVGDILKLLEGNCPEFQQLMKNDIKVTNVRCVSLFAYLFLVS